MTGQPYQREHTFQDGRAELRPGPHGFEFVCYPNDSDETFGVTLPPDFEGDPWEWFGDQDHLGAHPWSDATRKARDEINALGYDLDLVEDARRNSWVAVIFGPKRISMGRKVARATLRSEAAAAARDAVRAHEQDGVEWPAVD